MREIRVGDYVMVLLRAREDENKAPYYLDEMLKFVGETMKVKKITEKCYIELENCKTDFGIHYKWHKDWLLLHQPKLGEYITSIFVDEHIFIPKQVVFNYDKKRTTLIFDNETIVRATAHETDTYDMWFGFLIAITKYHLLDDKVKYKRFIEQLYSYPKKGMETALEFYVYNGLSKYLSNYQFNKLRDRIKNVKRNDETIQFKDFDINIKIKGLLPF